MSAYKIDLKSPELRDELIRRAELLESRINTIALGVSEVRWPEGTARGTARYYAKQLGLLDVDTAQEVAQTLVDESELRGGDFWATTLGRALFVLGAFPDESVDRPLARKILGLKSRQHVHLLVTEGKLVETQGQTITVESMRDLFHVT